MNGSTEVVPCSHLIDDMDVIIPNKEIYKGFEKYFMNVSLEQGDKPLIEDYVIEEVKIYQIKEEIHLLYKVFIYGELVKKLLTVVILLINYKITNYIILLVKRKKKNYY